MSNKQIRDQFNKQAQNFSNWTVSKNQEYLQAYFDFCGMTATDQLLDLACGSGEFAIFCAARISQVLGVDISERLIDLAAAQAHQNKLENVNFICDDVEQVPCNSNFFSIVTCKSAFHHMPDHGRVFREMVRCCQARGRVSLQDIVAYEEPEVDQFFEDLEHEIDPSHHRTLTKAELAALFTRNGLQISKELALTVELNFSEYLGHAQQSERAKRQIKRLIASALQEPVLAQYFRAEGPELFFRRGVYLILGEKQPGFPECGSVPVGRLCCS